MPIDDRIPRPEAGPVAWRSSANHNSMMDRFRAAPSTPSGDVELAYFGSSAFRITSPEGMPSRAFWSAPAIAYATTASASISISIAGFGSATTTQVVRAG